MVLYIFWGVQQLQQGLDSKFKHPDSRIPEVLRAEPRRNSPHATSRNLAWIAWHPARTVKASRPSCARANAVDAGPWLKDQSATSSQLPESLCYKHNPAACVPADTHRLLATRNPDPSWKRIACVCDYEWRSVEPLG